MTNVFFLIMGFALLIRSADILINGASVLARKLGVSDLFIGLTIVSFGTSMPELFVNIFSSAQGNVDIAIGNVVGSNIFNILIILGVASLISPLSMTKGTVWKEIPFGLLAVLVLGAVSNDMLLDGAGYSSLARIDGFIFLAFFMLFMYYVVSVSKDAGNSRSPGEMNTGLFKSLIIVMGGFAGLALGGKLVVDAAVHIAQRLGVSQSLIGLTVVAAGTSLPELATSAVAAYKRNSDIAVGNIIGSNIFNIFFILGISALIKPLPIATYLNADILVLAGSSILLFLFMFSGKRHIIDRWEGALFVVLYISYLVFLLKRG